MQTFPLRSCTENGSPGSSCEHSRTDFKGKEMKIWYRKIICGLCVLPFFLLAGLSFTAEMRENETLIVQGVSLTAWETLTPAEYDSAYTRLSDPVFLSQFSMKRGYPLTPWFPLLFPKSEAEFQKIAEMRTPDGMLLSEKRKELQRDVDRTLHEIHREQFLIPALRLSREKGLLLTYKVTASDQMPISFIWEDGALIRRAVSDGSQVSDFLANTISRQCGMPIPGPSPEDLLLLPDDFSCARLRALLENGAPAADCVTESQLPYVTMTVQHCEDGQVFAEVSHGPAVWKVIRLGAAREHFAEPARKFLERFEALGGIVRE